MRHRGEIVNEAIRKSGWSITAICKALAISRTTFYRWVEDPFLSLEAVFKIGGIIKHDFSKEFKELNQPIFEEPIPRYKTVTREKVSITVDLDGTDETLDKWLRLLPELNKAVKMQMR